MNHQPNVSNHEPHQATYQGYLLGFCASVGLTLTAYALVVQHQFSVEKILLVISGLAILQFIVQLVFFLHVGQELRPRWKLAALLFMLIIVIIVVLGSLWIMSNLNHHMMPGGGQLNQYLNDSDRL